MPETLPIAGVEDVSETTIELDGVTCILRLVWSRRREGWTVDVLSEDGEHLASGLPVAAGAPVLEDQRGAGFPPGRHVVIARDGVPGSISRDDWTSGRVAWMYFGAREVELL